MDLSHPKINLKQPLSQWSWAGAVPGSRPAASPQRACRVSSAGPPRCRWPGAPQGQLQHVGSAVMESTACSRCTSPYCGLKLHAALVGALKAPASSIALPEGSKCSNFTFYMPTQNYYTKIVFVYLGLQAPIKMSYPDYNIVVFSIL